MSAPQPHAAKPLRSPRGRRALPAALTALLGTLVFAAVATEALALAINGRTVGFRTSALVDFVRRTAYGDTLVLAVAVAILVVGGLLLAAALLPARRGDVELTERDPDIVTYLDRTSLNRSLTSAALSVDGVSSAKVGGRRATSVSAATDRHSSDDLTERIETRVSSRLTELAPRRRRAVRVRLSREDV